MKTLKRKLRNPIAMTLCFLLLLTKVSYADISSMVTGLVESEIASVGTKSVSDDSPIGKKTIFRLINDKRVKNRESISSIMSGYLVS